MLFPQAWPALEHFHCHEQRRDGTLARKVLKFRLFYKLITAYRLTGLLQTSPGRNESKGAVIDSIIAFNIVNSK